MDGCIVSEFNVELSFCCMFLRLLSVSTTDQQYLQAKLFSLMLNRFCIQMSRVHCFKAVIEFYLSFYSCISPYKRHIIVFLYVNNSLINNR